LITVGIGIVDVRTMRQLLKVPSATFILVSVILITVFVDLLAAVGFGMVVSSFGFMERMSKLVADKAISGELETMEKGMNLPEHMAKKIYEQSLDGPLFFGFADQFREQLRQIKDVEVIIISMHKVPFIDVSGVFAIKDIVEDIEARGMEVCFVGVQPDIYEQLEHFKIIPEVIGEDKVYNRVRTCVKYLKSKYGGEFN